jgi:hypothetical protein
VTAGSSGAYPLDRDILIKGHPAAIRTGTNRVTGGRRQFWLGGAYTKHPDPRGFIGSLTYEGLLIRFPPDQVIQHDLIDGLPARPKADAYAAGTNKMFVLNCRVENVDGYLNTPPSPAAHGDLFQMPMIWDPAELDGGPFHEVIIERFTGSTGLNGLNLAQQHQDDAGNGYVPIGVESVILRDINLKKTRQHMLNSSSDPTPVLTRNVDLLYLYDTGAGARGDRPFPITFDNVWLEPFASEGLAGCIASYGTNAFTGASLNPIIAGDGNSATWNAAFPIVGNVKKGPPTGGDFAVAAGVDGLGGLDIPGAGYVSPGYFMAAGVT